jgi:hypothetical protein
MVLPSVGHWLPQATIDGGSNNNISLRLRRWSHLVTGLVSQKEGVVLPE